MFLFLFFNTFFAGVFEQYMVLKTVVTYLLIFWRNRRLQVEKAKQDEEQMHIDNEVDQMEKG